MRNPHTITLIAAVLTISAHADTTFTAKDNKASITVHEGTIGTLRKNNAGIPQTTFYASSRNNVSGQFWRNQVGITCESSNGVTGGVIFDVDENGEPIGRIRPWLRSGELMIDKAAMHVCTIATVNTAETQPKQIWDLSKYVGLHASEVFNNLAVQEKFKELLGKENEHFLANLGVASRLEINGDFYTGRGAEAPTQQGIEESAFAINKETKDVFACILSNNAIRCYGTKSQHPLPAPLHDWRIETARTLKTNNLLKAMYEIKGLKKLTDKDMESCGLNTDNENIRMTDKMLEKVISCLKLK